MNLLFLVFLLSISSYFSIALGVPDGPMGASPENSLIKCLPQSLLVAAFNLSVVVQLHRLIVYTALFTTFVSQLPSPTPRPRGSPCGPAWPCTGPAGCTPGAHSHTGRRTSCPRHKRP